MKSFFYICQGGAGNVNSDAQTKGLTIGALSSRNAVVAGQSSLNVPKPLCKLNAQNAEQEVERIKEAFTSKGVLDPQLETVLNDALVAFLSDDPPEVLEVFAVSQMLPQTLIHKGEKPALDKGEDGTYAEMSCNILESNGGKIGGNAIFYHPFSWQYVAIARGGFFFIWQCKYEGYEKSEGAAALAVEAHCNIGNMFAFAPFMKSPQRPNDDTDTIADYTHYCNPSLPIRYVWQTPDYGTPSTKYRQARHGVEDVLFKNAPLKYNLTKEGIKTGMATSRGMEEVGSIHGDFDFTPIFVVRDDDVNGLQHGLIKEMADVDGVTPIEGSERTIVFTSAYACFSLEDYQARMNLASPFYRSSDAETGSLSFATVKQFIEEVKSPNKSYADFIDTINAVLMREGIPIAGEYTNSNGRGIVYAFNANDIYFSNAGGIIHGFETPSLVQSVGIGEFDGVHNVGVFRAKTQAPYNICDEVAISVRQNIVVYLGDCIRNFHVEYSTTLKIKVNMSIGSAWQDFSEDVVRSALMNSESVLPNTIFSDCNADFIYCVTNGKNFYLINGANGYGVPVKTIAELNGVNIATDPLEDVIQKLKVGFDCELTPSNYGTSYISVGGVPSLLVDEWKL